MPGSGQDSLNLRRTLDVNGKTYDYFSLPAAAETLGDISRLPFSLKVLLENLLRFEDGKSVTVNDIKAVVTWLKTKNSTAEISYRPARVLMQDFTGVPAVVDLAAMREAIKLLGGDSQKINPLSPVDLVIDHSVMVDAYATSNALSQNIDLEFERNGERYKFLRWGQIGFDNFRVVPPGTGICHQVNVEYLAQVVWTDEEDGKTVAYPDTLVGTDSHTTMVNGLAVLGWGVGGIEAEAAMLGQPIPMLIPEVTGFKLNGKLKEGTTAKNIYAIYGNSHDTPQGSLMFFPPAYQHDSTFNSNIGGINQDLIQYEPSLMYDSWITIGITDGDPQNLISSIGIDFDSWNSENPLNVDNGAVFLFEPDEVLSLNNEYIIGQITILSTLNVNVIFAVHGKRVNIYDPAWDEKNVIFILKPSSIHQITIPENCILWFNGCNYCAISDLNCINDDCGHLDGSHCVTFIDGH